MGKQGVVSFGNQVNSSLQSFLSPHLPFGCFHALPLLGPSSPPARSPSPSAPSNLEQPAYPPGAENSAPEAEVDTCTLHLGIASTLASESPEGGDKVMILTMMMMTMMMTMMMMTMTTTVMMMMIMMMMTMMITLCTAALEGCL